VELGLMLRFRLRDAPEQSAMVIRHPN
jgi:hypothetical protein